MTRRSRAGHRAAWPRRALAGPRAPLVVAVFLSATMALARSASADDTKRLCVKSAEAGQRLRDEGRPLAARAELLVCGRDVCPAIIRRHCGRWLEQIDASIPTVVIGARAGTGSQAVDVTDVAVAIDGAPVLATLNGQPLQVEPGEHAMTYTRLGAAPIHARVLLVAGEKNRRLTVDFPAGAPAALSTQPPGPESASPSRGSTSVRPAAWVFTGVALAAGASFAYFGVTGKSDLDSLRASCAGHCDASSVSGAWNKLILADVSLGVGVVGVALATWMFLTPRHREAVRPNNEGGNAASGLVFGPNARGVELGWQGRF